MHLVRSSLGHVGLSNWIINIVGCLLSLISFPYSDSCLLRDKVNDVKILKFKKIPQTKPTFTEQNFIKKSFDIFLAVKKLSWKSIFIIKRVWKVWDILFLSLDIGFGAWQEFCLMKTLVLIRCKFRRFYEIPIPLSWQCHRATTITVFGTDNTKSATGTW